MVYDLLDKLGNISRPLIINPNYSSHISVPAHSLPKGCPNFKLNGSNSKNI